MQSYLKRVLHATLPVAALLFAALLFTGCQPAEQIETYTIERTAPPKPPLDTAAYAKQLDHILVAILPQEKKAWFFKLVGKAPAIERQQQAFRDFIATVNLADASTDTPTWDVPEGWQEKEASKMRAATLVLPDEDGELELAVSSLPLSVDWEEFLVPNVNRWLRQLQRDPLPKATVLKLAKQLATKNGEATLFELSGRMAQQPGTNPHAGLGIPAPPARPSAPAPSAPAKQPTPPPAANPPKKQTLAYDTPEGWLPGKMSMMRKAAFLLPGGGPSDEVTVMSFPAIPGGQMSDVNANVRRWAGQVGLTKLTDDELEKLTEKMTISGIEGTYVQLESPEAASSVAIFAAMAQKGEQVWFFKMVGKRDLVTSQRDAFRKFLASVRFE